MFGLLLNMRVIFILCLIVAVYLTYVSPWMKTVSTFRKDAQLNGHLGIIAIGKSFDERSHKKALYHLQRFFYYYSQSYYNNTSEKLKYHHYNCMKYLRRIVFNLHNDENLKHGITQAIENVNIILENYIFENSDRNNTYYFGQYA